MVKKTKKNGLLQGLMATGSSDYGSSYVEEKVLEVRVVIDKVRGTYCDSFFAPQEIRDIPILNMLSFLGWKELSCLKEVSKNSSLNTQLRDSYFMKGPIESIQNLARSVNEKPFYIGLSEEAPLTLALNAYEKWSALMDPPFNVNFKNRDSVTMLRTYSSTTRDDLLNLLKCDNIKGYIAREKKAQQRDSRSKLSCAAALLIPALAAIVLASTDAKVSDWLIDRPFSVRLFIVCLFLLLLLPVSI